MSVKNRNSIVTDGLVFYVDAGNSSSYSGSGTTWSDLVGSNDGTLTNGPTYSSTNGGAVVFDAVDDYVVFPHDSALNVDSITVEIICSFDSFFNGYGVAKRTSHNIDNAFFLGLGSNTLLRWQHSTNGTQALNLDYTHSMNTTDTYHIVGTYAAAGGKKLYVDAQEVASNTNSGNLYQSSDDLYIGTDGRLTPGFNAMDNFFVLRIYNRALSSTEVLQNYNALKNRFI